MDRETAAPEIRTADRLSELPDEILRRILIAASLDLKTAAQTSLFSKRWRYLWRSCITKLNFHIGEWSSFTQFVENSLSIRSNGEYEDIPALELLSLTTDQMLLPEMYDLLQRIFDYGVANQVRTFRLSLSRVNGLTRLYRAVKDSIPPGLTAMCGSVENLELSIHGDLQMLGATNFAAVKTLRLDNCVFRPSRKAIRGRVPEISGRVYDVLFKGFPNLKRLELHECYFMITNFVAYISGGDHLVELVMVWSKLARHQFQQEMLVCGSKVKSLTCREMKANWLKSFQLPSLECLDIDAYVNLTDDKDLTKTSMKVFHHFQKFAGLKRVKLHPRTIEVLTMVPGLLEMEASPFTSMECVEFHDCGSLISNQRVFNALISYFFDDCIRGTALMDRISSRQGASSNSSSRPVVVYKSDLA